jgi:hypothetical protein
MDGFWVLGSRACEGRRIETCKRNPLSKRISVDKCKRISVDEPMGRKTSFDSVQLLKHTPRNLLYLITNKQFKGKFCGK